MRNSLSILYTLCFSVLFQVSFSQKKKPNVILIMVDDMGNNIASLGNPWVKTPQLDKFKESSVYLSNFHQELMCTPSRASIMTGRNALKTRAWRTSVGRSNLPTEEVTLAEVFKANDYKTGMFGKWHLGDVWPFRPSDQGFDESVKFKCGGISQISDYWGNDYFDDVYYHNNKPKQYKGYCADVFFNETMRFAKDCKQSNNPFFIYLATNTMHLPAIVGEEYYNLYKNEGRPHKQSIFYGMITNFDDNLGRLNSFLEENDLTKDTIVIITTDDGTAGYATQFDENYLPNENGFNMGQKGGKGSAYEGGHRLFSFVKWDGVLKANKEMSSLTTITDIYPTVLDLCDIEYDSNLIDGKSFKSNLFNTKKEINTERKLFLTKLVPNKPLDFKRNLSCVVYKDWRLINNKELYNVKQDRSQIHNVAEDNPQVVKELQNDLTNYFKENATEREVPVRFLIGDKQHKVIELTTQDLWGSSVFSQGQVSKLQKGSGPWKINVLESGDYAIKLSRYPLNTGLSFNSKTNGKKSLDFNPEKGKIEVGGKVHDFVVDPNENFKLIKVHLDKGEQDLETWLYAKEGTVVPAYFVQIERL